MSNNKGHLRKAHEQFLADLKQDKDFKEYRDKAFDPTLISNYGVVIAGQAMHTLNQLGDNNIIPQDTNQSSNMKQTFNFNQYLTNMAGIAAKLEKAPFEDMTKLFIIRKERDTELPNMLATVVIGDESNYQTLGIYKKNGGLQIVGASQNIDSLTDDNALELFEQWLTGK
jgi:hypothetical protein